MTLYESTPLEIHVSEKVRISEAVGLTWSHLDLDEGPRGSTALQMRDCPHVVARNDETVCQPRRGYNAKGTADDRYSLAG
jgi:integrase